MSSQRAGKTRTESKAGYVRTSKGDKFVGGAAVARLNAVRKGRGNRILRPGEKQRSEQVVPHGLSPFERFFAGLLKGEASDFLKPDTLSTWKAICDRLRLPFPQGPLKHYYDDQKQHFSYRASLIMEESRYAISQGLREMQRRSSGGANEPKPPTRRCRQTRYQQRKNATPSNTMILSLTGVEARERNDHCTLTFLKEVGGPFTPNEVQSLRQGTIFACVSENLSSTVSNSVLGCILASSRETMIKTRSFTVMVFKPVSKSQESIWRLTPIASLLTEQRKFDACVGSNAGKIPFLLPLLGGKKPTHIKFSEQENGEMLSVKVEQDESCEVNLCSQGDMEEAGFLLPTLNSTQEKAAATFLNSQPNTITLIQGPPGTGKTTLLVNIICQYLVDSISSNKARCLMVCAPTNKAVSVLCTRFLGTLQGRGELPCNILLVGDDDKLLDDEQSRNGRGRDTSTLRSIFLYTWIKTVLDSLSSIQGYVARPTSNQREQQRILNLTKQLVKKLRQSLSQFPQDMGIALDRVIKLLGDGIVGGTITQKEALDNIGALVQEIEDWKPDLIWQDLLSSAHIIFCTLASSGAGILKRSVGQVDDLIVDEAAASCEPEMYIPFHFMPQRLLAVGDPKQLPATVMSQIAADRGLGKSLHERLMYDAAYPHIMLDVQYRMKPEISHFPSKHFYSGKLADGPNVVSPDYSGPLLLGGQHYSFLNICGVEKQSASGSFENYAEAQEVVKLVREASHRMKGRWQSADRIRIITFYTAQVLLIKRLLYQARFSDVIVATVDSSQGSEADIVIVSFVRSRGTSRHASVGFLSDDRRLNVAITRAKHQLICVGNAGGMSTLSKANAQTIRALGVDAFQRNCVLSSQNQTNGCHKKRLNMEMHEDGRDRKRAKGERTNKNQVERTRRAQQSFNATNTSAVEETRLPKTSNCRPAERSTLSEAHEENVRQENRIRAEKARSGNTKRERSVALCSSSESSTSESSSSSDSSSDGSTSDDSVDSVKASRILPDQSTSQLGTKVKVEVTAGDETSQNENVKQDGAIQEFCVRSDELYSQPEEFDQSTGNSDSVIPNIANGRDTARGLEKSENKPLALSSSLVMSYDSASCGDNGSEIGSDSDEGHETWKAESRTNMKVGTQKQRNKISASADCYDIDI